ncbi:MAG: polyprenyl synthetase family protein [Clostridiaceae bacterium]|nr:polyprenyl synthetase family protein [Clostridiaceae bacterium]
MTSHLAAAPGKMIRARALLACAIDMNSMIHPDAINAAASVELLHLATLVHDDIIDDADKRRGIAALHKKYGEKYAVLCGDFLFCTALEFVSSVTPPESRKDSLDRTFPHYLTEVCLGELRQDQNSGNLSLSEREYFKIIKGKTAALFEASFYTGFIFSDEPDAAKEIYKEIGGNIGLIFQLADDCADYESTEILTKKPVLSDWSRGIVTLPLIYALKKDDTLSSKIASGMSPVELKDAIESAGGFSYTHSRIVGLHKKTEKLIESLTIDPAKKKILVRLLRKSSGIAV